MFTKTLQDFPSRIYRKDAYGKYRKRFVYVSGRSTAFCLGFALANGVLTSTYVEKQTLFCAENDCTIGVWIGG